MPNCGQTVGFQIALRPNRASCAKCLCLAKNCGYGAAVILTKIRSILRNCSLAADRVQSPPAPSDGFSGRLHRL
jgi:hypothetical protein